MANSHLGLAKIYQHQEKYPAALVEIDAAEKIDPERTDVHYVRGRVLLQMGRKAEAKKEMEAALHINRAQMDTGTVPSPELMQDPQ
jgi:Tfp pilus assembly protein PilF